MDKIQAWMSESLRLAKIAAQEDEVPVGAVVVYQDRIVGRGYNRREQTQSPLSHAEVMAIQEASQSLGSWRLIDCTLVVTLEPCLMCLAASQQARIQKILYGTSDQKGGALSLGYEFHLDQRMHHRFSVELWDTPECGDILSQFFSQKRKKSR